MVKAVSETRALYNALQQKKKKGEFATNSIITESFLRFETPLTSSQSVTFNVLAGMGANQQSTEHRLKTPDSFIITEMSLMIRKTTSTITAAQSKLFTYPEATVFSKAGESQALENVYNGFMTVKIDQTTWIDSLDLSRFRRVGLAQQGLAVSANATANIQLQSEQSNNSWGYDCLTPSIKLDGGSNNDITLNLPESIDMTGVSGTTNFAVLVVRGFLVQRGSKLYSPRRRSN